MPQDRTRPLAVSMGEPQGIGPDLILQLYARRAEIDLPPFVVFGEPNLLRARAGRLGFQIEVCKAAPEDAISAFETALPVVSVGKPIADLPGHANSANGDMVIAAITQGVDAVQSGICRALVTAPIHKAVLYAAGFKYPGHTEFLAALCGRDGVDPLPVMMLAHEDYRVVPLTVHIPLAEVPGRITGRLITEAVHTVDGDLKSRFGIDNPRIALCGLNPHAGEAGTIGLEDRDVIAPAIANLRTKGLDVTGPLSADTLFHPPHWRQYDCVIAMYHDQALIPIKTLAFDAGVNVTLGLPIIRTSPDHGTAFALAGTGQASDRSLRAAIKMADAMSRGTA